MSRRMATAGQIDTLMGANLAAIRTRRGLSQDELGSRLAIPQGEIKAYEEGRERIKPSMLTSMQGVLACEMLDFFREPGSDGIGKAGNGSRSTGASTRSSPPVLHASEEV